MSTTTTRSAATRASSATAVPTSAKWCAATRLTAKSKLASANGSSSAKQITSGEFGEANFQWTADGTRLTFVSNREKEPYYQSPDSDLYSVAAGGGELTKVASIEGTIGDYAVSHDGKRLAFVGTLAGAPVRSYSQSDLWVMDLPSGTPHNFESLGPDGGHRPFSNAAGLGGALGDRL